MSRRHKQLSKNAEDERWMTPAFGVVHRILPTDELDFFFHDLEEKLEVLPRIIVRNESGAEIGERPQAKLFHPGRLSLRVVERRLTQEYGKRSKFHWSARDRVGIEQEIADTIGKFDMGGRVLRAAMGEAHRLGDADAAMEEGKVLAITPEASSVEAEFFATEHEIAVNGIATKLRRFRTTAPYLPNISIGRIHHSATPEQVGSIIELVQAALPVEVELNPVEFTPRRRS